MNEFKLTHEMLKNFGSCSLSGHLVMADLLPAQGPIRILFPHKQHVEHITIPDYVPLCLCENIAVLAEMGVKLSFAFYKVVPEES